MVLTQDLSQHHKRAESLQAWNATALMLRDKRKNPTSEMKMLQKLTAVHHVPGLS